jgi:hypothetical protein
MLATSGTMRRNRFTHREVFRDPRLRTESGPVIKHRPTTLGPEDAMRLSLPNAEMLLIDTGHFALETHGQEIVSHVERFFAPRS